MLFHQGQYVSNNLAVYTDFENVHNAPEPSHQPQNGEKVLKNYIEKILNR